MLNRPNTATAIDARRPGAAAFGWRKQVLVGVAIGALYFVAARIGLLLVAMPQNVAVLWPASGIAAGALILLGRRGCLPVAVGVVAGTLAAYMLTRGHPLVSLSFGLCNALECLLVWWVFERLERSQHRLESTASLLAFLLAVVAGTAIAAIPATAILSWSGSSKAPLFDLWRTWFAADLIGIVAISPLIFTGAALLSNPPRPLVWLEGLVGCAMLVAGLAYTFGLYTNQQGLAVVSPPAVAFPLLLWIASRTPPAFSALAALCGSVIVVMAALAGTGRFAEGLLPALHRIESAQISVLAVSVGALALAGVFARNRNIADRLQASEQRLNQALGAAGIYAFDYDLVKGTVHRVGELVHMLGLSAHGTPDDYIERIHPDDRAKFERALRSLSPQTRAFATTVRVKANDGSYLTLQHSAECVLDARMRLVRIVGSCINVTKARETERALEESEERLQKVTEAARIFSFDCDMIAGSVWRSSNAADILGFDDGQAIVAREHFRRRVHPTDMVAQDKARTQMTTAQPNAVSVIRYERSDGNTLWLEVFERGTFDAEGKLVRVSGITRDVTQRKLAEDRQAGLIDELNHRVKNILARMVVVIQRSRQSHDTLDDYIRALSGRIGSMARTHERLATSQWTGVSLETLVEDELEPYRTPSNIVVEGELIMLPPPVAQAVSTTLHELATNAAKYGGLATPEGRVEVKWLSKEDGATSGRVLYIDWKEYSSSAVRPATREGFGTSTIRNLLRYEYKARVELLFEQSGVRCRIAMPIKQLKAGGE